MEIEFLISQDTSWLGNFKKGEVKEVEKKLGDLLIKRGIAKAATKKRATSKR